MTMMINTKKAPPAGRSAPGKLWQQSVEQVLADKQSQADGRDPAEAWARLQQYSPNALPEKKGNTAWLRVLAHFNDVLTYILLAATVLTVVMGHWVDTVVILGVVVINALIGHIQESNAEKPLKRIRNMLSSEARVIRNGSHETIPATEIVPGDIIALRAGGGAGIEKHRTRRFRQTAQYVPSLNRRPKWGMDTLPPVKKTNAEVRP